MSTFPCPYFTLSVGIIPILGSSQGLRIPICRCVLTEVLVARLQTNPEGEKLASYLQGPPLECQIRPIIGSDLKPVSAATCTNERKQTSCLPEFLTYLHDFRLDNTIPTEE